MRTLRRAPPSADLDLVPVMNLVAILIPFVLVGAQFLDLAVLPAQVAGEGPSAGPVRVVAAVSRDRVTLRGLAAEVVVPCRLPADAPCDLSPLTEALAGLPAGSEPAVVLAVHDGVPFEQVVRVMDAMREDAGGRALARDIALTRSR